MELPIKLTMTEWEAHQLDCALDFLIEDSQDSSLVGIANRLKDSIKQFENKGTYIIAYSGSSGNGYVSFENKPCSTSELAMKFDSYDEAENKRLELQRVWVSQLTTMEVA